MGAHFLTETDEYGLRGKVIIVTGAGGPVGLDHAEGVSNGRAAAITLARSGAKVCLIGRQQLPLENTAQIIQVEGGEAFPIIGDVGLEDDCRDIVDACLGRYGRLDGLDNSVGVARLGGVADIELDDWRESFRLNVESMMLMCKYAIPHMALNISGGAIVNIGSLSAPRPRGATAYSVSKGAVEYLTTSVAVEHAADGIRANCIVLGPVYTPLTAPHIKSEDDRERRKIVSPLKREGTAWDTANLVRFLLSDQSRYLTGQRIYLDGGISLIGPNR